jgi:enoyl-CoA hydratase
MLHVTLEQIRRARHMTVAQDLRMERGMMRHCFFPEHLRRQGVATDVAEGIRARVVDKDNAPHWQPSRIEDVTQDMVQPFFVSPWPEQNHPLRMLA